MSLSLLAEGHFQPAERRFQLAERLVLSAKRLFFLAERLFQWAKRRFSLEAPLGLLGKRRSLFALCRCR